MPESETPISTPAQAFDSAREIKETWFVSVAIVFAYAVVLQPGFQEGWLGGDTEWIAFEALRFVQLILSGLIYGVAFALPSAKMLKLAGHPRSGRAAMWLGCTFTVWVVPVTLGLAASTMQYLDDVIWAIPLVTGFIAALVLGRATRSAILGVLLGAVSVATSAVWWIDPWVEAHTLNMRLEYYPPYDPLPTMCAFWTICAISAVGWWSLRKARSPNPQSAIPNPQ